jgi:hypothetical protein
VPVVSLRPLTQRPSPPTVPSGFALVTRAPGESSHPRGRQTRFRKVAGYRGLATIAIAIERDLYRRRHHLEQEATTTATV